MVVPDLQALYQLHKVDVALFEIKSKAAGLDLGHSEVALFKTLEAESAPAREETKQLTGELKKLELEQQARRDKIAKFDKQMYDGTITNAREMENVQKEIKLLTEQANVVDDRILVLMETAPRAAELSAEAEKKLSQLRKIATAKHDAAKVEHAKLQEEYKEGSLRRKALAEKVPPMLLKTYENVRTKTASTAVAFVTKEKRCSICGMHTPEKAIDLLNLGKIVQCEQCRRIMILAD